MSIIGTLFFLFILTGRVVREAIRPLHAVCISAGPHVQIEVEDGQNDGTDGDETHLL